MTDAVPPPHRSLGRWASMPTAADLVPALEAAART